MARRCFPAGGARAASASRSEAERCQGWAAVHDRARLRRVQALPKQSRLSRRAEFLRAYESGRKYFSRFCVLFVSDNNLDRSRLGITATRKIGKATVRNRLKRWVREIYRTERGPLGVDEHCSDFIVNLKAAAATAQFRDFKSELTVLLRRAAARNG
jgi:ribonuclease P protein component